MSGSALHISEMNSVRSVAISSVCDSILRTLAYYDIFHYPLEKDEIRKFLDRITSDQVFDEAIKQLLETKKIFLLHEFYSLQDNYLLAIRRKQGNRFAEELMIKALKIGRFLYKFPFTRAIGVSGSLSKNFADEKADIDFFIIARSGRLWIARTLMHLYKKLTFLTGRQHYYCMNYFIDETSMLLPDQNIYSAIEIKTLVPVSGEETMLHFFEINQWSDDWLPACNFRRQQVADNHRPRFKSWLERMLNGKSGDKIENYLLRITQSRWKRKELAGKRNAKGQTMGLRTGKNFAISNPGDFQQKLLFIYEQKIAALKEKPVMTLAVSSLK
jgi:hypothetical protein